MAQRANSRPGRSPARSPARAAQNTTQQKAARGKDYTSEGVKDNDITKLGGNDWEVLGVLTVVAMFVRLFRIHQPSSVVFDEVQYASHSS